MGKKKKKWNLGYRKMPLVWYSSYRIDIGLYGRTLRIQPCLSVSRQPKRSGVMRDGCIDELIIDNSVHEKKATRHGSGLNCTYNVVYNMLQIILLPFITRSFLFILIYFLTPRKLRYVVYTQWRSYHTPDAMSMGASRISPAQFKCFPALKTHYLIFSGKKSEIKKKL